MHAAIMRDYGLNKGLIQEFQTSDKRSRGVFYGFRKMFWNYLKKLNVPFFDPCCAEADGQDVEPIGWDESLGQIVRYNGTAWVAVTAFTTTTTTSTTTSSTTTTTTAP